MKIDMARKSTDNLRSELMDTPDLTTFLAANEDNFSSASAVVCKAVFLHRTGNIALRRGLRFFQRLIVQLIVKAVFKMVIGCDLIGCGHLRGISVNGFCGQPFRFFREGVIQFPHFLDLCVDIACPQMLFTPATSAEEVVTVSAQAVQQHIIPAVIDKGRKFITSCLCGFLWYQL